MTDSCGKIHDMDDQSLLRRINELELGTLDEGGQAELEQALETSSHARDLYFEHFKLTALLTAESEIRATQGTLPFVGNRLQQRRRFQRSFLTAAAVLLLALVAASLIVPQRIAPDSLSLHGVPGTQWDVPGTHHGEPSSSLQKGQSLVVTSGTVSLARDHAAKIIVQGPALIRFPELDQPVIERGWLWVDSREGDPQIRITTPELTVRNIGTRFGVRVRSDKSSEIHLIDGIVEVGRTGTKKMVRLESEESGIFFPLGEKSDSLALAVDPFPTLERLLDSAPGYITTVLSQSPSGYWRLDDPYGRRGSNLADEASVAMFDRHVELGVPGVRPDDGFPGFPTDNLGVRLPGASEESVIHSLDCPAGVSEEEGSVVFWFRRPSGLQEAEILWHAGAPASGKRRHELRLALNDHGHAEFFIENGRWDVLLKSNTPLADDHWHQLAVTWSTDEVRLFVDGRQVSRDGAYRDTDGPSISNRMVRFGKMGPFSTAHLAHYKGRVDEIALWSRSLTSGEVRTLYNAARGPTAPR